MPSRELSISRPKRRLAAWWRTVFAQDLKFFGARTGGIVEIADGVPGAELFEPDDWAGLTDALARWAQ
ncbi:MAG TPA: hypothetical protein VKV04_00490 [Verrucomicrobiae bacterium]|nr:hypothetical protein [Verrucomicrobiae bacterium]